jgi:hypothetical protein
MNLKALMSGQPVNEAVNIGDAVKVGAKGEKKREGVVKVPHGPGGTKGVLIDGELEMVADDEINRAKEKKASDEKVEESIYSDDDLLEEGIMGMTMLPSLERMQALAGIKNEAYTFATAEEDTSEDDADDSEAETETETETEEADTDEGDAETETETEETDDQGEEAEVSLFVAAEEPTDEVEQAADDMTDAVESQPTAEIEAPAAPAAPSPNLAAPFQKKSEGPNVAANHPATAGEVQMMSTPVEPEPMPTDVAEDAPATPLQACLNSIAEIERSLPQVAVKDFNDVRKRLEGIMTSLFEGSTGRGRKL